MMKYSKLTFSVASLVILSFLLFGVGGLGPSIVMADTSESEGVGEDVGPVTSPTGQNLVLNHGFEDGLEHWGRLGEASQFVIVTDQVYTGEKALRLNGVGNWNAITQAIAVKPETNYRLTLWARATANLAGEGAMYSILDSNGNHNEAGPAWFYRDSTWGQYILDFNSGEHHLIQIYLGDGGGLVYFDEFHLFEMEDL